MKQGYSRLFHIITFLLVYTVSIAENFDSNSSNPWFFKKITKIDGLSQSSVNCFFEDELGFMWVGTDDGLNKYDGNSFEVFSLEKRESEVLSNSAVLDLKADSSRNIRIGTASGLGMFIVKEATEKLKVHVELESVEKHSSLFLLSFPINPRS